MKFGHLILLASCMAFGAQNAHAAGVQFDVEFTDSSYQVTSGNTFGDLLTQHQLASTISSNSVTALAGINTTLYAGGITGDYSVLISATLDIKVAGSYEFQIGADWGRGGGVALFDTATNTILQETVDSSDIWWANNWSHPDVISTTYSLSASEYTIMWLGFEGCCAGSSTIRFAFDGGAFSTLDMTSIAPSVVPVPASVYFLASALMGLLGSRRRRISHS